MKKSPSIKQIVLEAILENAENIAQEIDYKWINEQEGNDCSLIPDAEGISVYVNGCCASYAYPWDEFFKELLGNDPSDYEETDKKYFNRIAQKLRKTADKLEEIWK
jgi:hypothetical protein